MIESWRALAQAMRRGRLVLVPLLAVLITAHLASAAHSAPYSGSGSHAGIVAVCPPQQHAAAPEQPTVVPDPVHDHDSGEHVDHSVDRPRDPGAQELAAPELPALLPLASASARTQPARQDEGRAGPPGHGDERSLLCVWRQ